MRFSADIFFIDRPQSNIPTNYRRNVVSLLKEAIKANNPELHNQLWGDPKANSSKPFTFSVYLPDVQSFKGENNNYLQISNDISDFKAGLFISSSDPIVLINFYNSLLNIPDYKLFGSGIELKHFRLLQEVSFNERVASFKTMSPMIVRNMTERNDKNKKDSRYLTFGDADFEENLYHSIKRICKDFINDSYDFTRDEFKFSPVNCRIVKIHHYKEIIQATSGTFRIEAPAEVLKLIYDAGIGARRSQGFGMVNVVKDIDEMEGGGI